MFLLLSIDTLYNMVNLMCRYLSLSSSSLYSSTSKCRFSRCFKIFSFFFYNEIGFSNSLELIFFLNILENIWHVPRSLPIKSITFIKKKVFFNPKFDDVFGYLYQIFEIQKNIESFFFSLLPINKIKIYL